MTTGKKRIPRGIRNNNPLNLRVGNNWKGEVSQPTDHTFEQFTEMKWGVRAAFIVLRNYIKRHKCNTVRFFINNHKFSAISIVMWQIFCIFTAKF